MQKKLMKKSKEIHLETLLFSHSTRLSDYVNKKHLALLKNTFEKSQAKKEHSLIQEETLVLRFIHFLCLYIADNFSQAQETKLFTQDLIKELSTNPTDYEKRRIILRYSFIFTPSKKQQIRDEKAFERFFDEDALIQRIQEKISHLQRQNIVALERLGNAFTLLQEVQTLKEDLWKTFELNRYFTSYLNYKEESLVNDEILHTILKITTLFYQDSTKDSETFLDKKLFKKVYHIALSHKESVWMQNDALVFLAEVAFPIFVEIAIIRASDYRYEENIFVRHTLTLLIFEYVQDNPQLHQLIEELILKDPSPYVRQAIAKSLGNIQTPSLRPLVAQCILHDTDSSVRALSLTQILYPHTQEEQFQTVIWQSIRSEKDPFVLKTALFCLAKYIEQIRQKKENYQHFIDESYTALSDFIHEDIPIALKRYTALMKEFIWVCQKENTYVLYVNTLSFVKNIAVGKSQKIPSHFYDNPEIFYRVLSVVAQNDFSLELREGIFSGLYLQRSEQFKRRLWRILFEMKTPSPDKRQGFLHTIARVFRGTKHFPSSILAEQAPTKVPGEPYLIPEEESARPFIPLADHFLSALMQDTLKIQDYKIYTADGITTIKVPRFFFQRFICFLKLSWKFASIAPLRNWREGSTLAPSSYIKSMEKLGFHIHFKPYIPKEKSSTKFFSMALPIPFLTPQIQNDISNYFVSAYENSLSDLVLFLLVFFALFFVRHVILSRQISKARKGIALSIGGWGTRGKSGTERVKAALFNALGLKVFSKTTGNEAMFLHADSFEEMREMYLFRPYDKATIWEQANTVLLADKLDVDVYLWESMGLTPSYVHILQQRWMKDNIATITNTYPDHENLQGPAGINIPQVMTNFIPEHSTLVSSEEVMYPILEAHAHSVHTQSFSTGWLEAGLLAPDILSRFPYEEHPYNIALVLGVATQLDINHDKALKAMADNIVPDLGVLKAYPPATVEKRKLLFINGMSANERFGALGNWKRMGLGDIDDEKESDIFLSTVINNRADRVSRSRVFASMLIEDIHADCYILIGSNLSGFQSYVEQSWQEYKAKLSLVPTQSDSSLLLLERYAKNFRIFRTPTQLKMRLSHMLETQDISNKEICLSHFLDLEKLSLALAELEAQSKEEILAFYRPCYEEYQEYHQLKQDIKENKKSIEILSDTFQKNLWLWINRRIVFVHDYHATGNDVVNHIKKNTPLGLCNKIIGMQNIKGTGLDFAYRWVAWNTCYHICQDIQSENTKAIRQGIEALANFNEHGILSNALALESLTLAKKHLATQTQYYQSQIHIIEKTIKDSQKNQETKKGNTTQNTSFFKSITHKILEITEAFLDAGDAVKRRKKSDRIYQDLTQHHISHKRAAIELQKITKRQKGGWFVQKFKS